MRFIAASSRSPITITFEPLPIGASYRIVKHVEEAENLNKVLANALPWKVYDQLLLEILKSHYLVPDNLTAEIARRITQ